jgi:hypothetical protein
MSEYIFFAKLQNGFGNNIYDSIIFLYFSHIYKTKINIYIDESYHNSNNNSYHNIFPNLNNNFNFITLNHYNRFKKKSRNKKFDCASINKLSDISYNNHPITVRNNQHIPIVSITEIEILKELYRKRHNSGVSINEFITKIDTIINSSFNNIKELINNFSNILNINESEIPNFNNYIRHIFNKIQKLKQNRQRNNMISLSQHLANEKNKQETHEQYRHNRRNYMLYQNDNHYSNMHNTYKDDANKINKNGFVNINLSNTIDNPKIVEIIRMNRWFKFIPYILQLINIQCFFNINSRVIPRTVPVQINNYRYTNTNNLSNHELDIPITIPVQINNYRCTNTNNLSNNLSNHELDIPREYCCIHIRYGDKLCYMKYRNIFYGTSSYKFLLYHPQFYIDIINNVLTPDNPNINIPANIPIIIITDSKDIVNTCIIPHLNRLNVYISTGSVIEDYNLLCNATYAILSYSTFSFSAIFLNRDILNNNVYLIDRPVNNPDNIGNSSHDNVLNEDYTINDNWNILYGEYYLKYILNYDITTYTDEYLITDKIEQKCENNTDINSRGADSLSAVYITGYSRTSTLNPNQCLEGCSSNNEEQPSNNEEQPSNNEEQPSYNEETKNKADKSNQWSRATQLNKWPRATQLNKWPRGTKVGGAKKPLVKSTKKPHVKSTKKPLVKSTKKTLTKTTKKPLVKSTKKPLIKSTKKTLTKTTKKPLVKSIKKPLVKSIKKPLVKSIKKPLVKSIKKPTKKTLTKTIKKPLVKSTKKTLVKSTKKTLVK